MKYTFDKLKWLLITAGIVFFGFVISSFKILNIFEPKESGAPPQTTVSPSVTASVNLSIDFGNGKTSFYEGVEANGGETAYSLLARKLKETGAEVVTKKYDFGLMVEAIDNIANTTDRFWSYSVNDQAGSVAADKYVLQNGDAVEWKYTKM